MSLVKGPRESGVIQVSDPVHFRNTVSGVGGDVVQGRTIYVDNNTARSPGGNDDNTGYSRSAPKVTIQSAIDQAPANSGSRIIVMGSPTTDAYYATGHHAATGSALYGMYREKLNIYYNDYGLQLIGINRPFITGQDGTTQDLTGYTPTIQIGSVGVASTGPNFVHISGFHIGGFGDDGDDAADSNVYGTGIAIGQYDDTLSDDVYSTLIENCTFRSSNDASAGQTNDEEIHTWIKAYGTEKTRVRNCLFFGGQHAIAMNGSTLNNCMFWEVDNCHFLNQKTYALYSSASPLWCNIRNCVISPSAAGKELFFSGGTYSSVSDCCFPMSSDALDDAGGLISSATLGTWTGWAVMGGRAQLGFIYDKN